MKCGKVAKPQDTKRLDTVAHNRLCIISAYNINKGHSDKVIYIILLFVLLLCRYAFVDVYATYWANLTTPYVNENLQSKS